MHPQLEAIFDEAENRYLKPEELKFVTQYVSSIPDRVATYRSLRDQELDIVQWVADQLQAQMPKETVENLERSLKHALLMLRYCSMGMLLNDEEFVKARLVDWVSQSVKVYHSQAIDSALYKLLNQRLNQVLGAKAMSFLNPMLMLAQKSLLQPESNSAESMNGVAVGP
jgi:hypothetical protein